MRSVTLVLWVTVVGWGIMPQVGVTVAPFSGRDGWSILPGSRRRRENRSRQGTRGSEERTKQIKLGTGVTSLPYHHPLMIADDLLQLDHMTRGRTMLGCGPGVLTSDAVMMGIPPELQRQRMAESLEAVMRLTTSDEPVTMKTDWFELNDARLQMSWYSDPHPEIACAATVTPTGPTLAGKHGVGLLSVAGLGGGNFGQVWEWCEEAAAESGQTVERANWRVVVQMHLADTKEQAIADVKEGFAGRAYFGDSKDPGAGIGGLFGGQAATIEEGLEMGNMIVGTPDEAIETITRRSVPGTPRTPSPSHPPTQALREPRFRGGASVGDLRRLGRCSAWRTSGRAARRRSTPTSC